MLALYNSKKDNGITNDANYRVHMLYLLPNVKVLDFQNVDISDRIKCINLYRMGAVSENADLLVRINAVKQLVETKRREIAEIKAEIERTEKMICEYEVDKMLG